MTDHITAAQYLALSDASVCKVQLHKTGGALIGVTIEFAGPVANLPSKGNGKTIAPYIGSARFFRPGRGRIVNSKDSHKREKDITQHYTVALMDMGEIAPTFHEAKVHVTAILSTRMNRQDSHNAPKFIGDWLEKVGIVNNDKQAQIWALRRSDYSTLCKESDSTRIEVQLLSAVQNLVEATVLECRRRMSA